MTHMKNKTLGFRVAEELVSLIQERGYCEGDKLPNEYELSSQLGVSRNTIREAVRALVTRNILDIRQGAGTFVSKKKGVSDDPLGFLFMEDHLKLVEDLMQIRYIIEPQIVALAAQNATPKEVAILGDLCNDIKKLICRRKDFTQKDIDFHAQIATCSRNIVMSNLIPVICQGITVFSSIIEKEFDQTIKSHQEIYESVRDHRVADAQQAMLFHLLYNRNRFIEKKDL